MFVRWAKKSVEAGRLEGPFHIHLLCSRRLVASSSARDKELKLKRGGVAKAKEVTEKDGVAVAAHWPLFSMRFAWLVGKVHEAF